MPAKLDIAKTAVNFIVGGGVTKIVNDVIANNTDPETTKEKIEVAAGSLVLATMIVGRTSEYTNARMDEAALWLTKLKDKKNPTE